MTTIDIFPNSSSNTKITSITIPKGTNSLQNAQTIKNNFDDDTISTVRTTHQPFWISNEHRELLLNNNIKLISESQPWFIGRDGFSFSGLKINDTAIINKTNNEYAIMSNLKQEYWLSTEKDQNVTSYNQVNFTFFAADYGKLLDFYFSNIIERFNEKFSSVKKEKNYVETFKNDNKDDPNFFFFEIKGFGPTVKIYKYNKVDDTTKYEEKIQYQDQTFDVLKKKEEISGEEWFRAFLWYSFLSAWHIFYIAILIIIIYIEEIIEIIQETLKETAESNLARKRLINKKSKATRLANQAEVEGKIRKANRKLRKIKLEQDQEEMKFKQKEQIQKNKIKKQKDLIEDK